MEGFSSLLRASKIAQVATPISKSIRGANPVIPTHQVIYTPKSSAVRSDYGIKTTLPKQVGYSHIAFNDMDNKTGMPDVEKSTSKMYSRIRLQENGIHVAYDQVQGNPLFSREEYASNHKPKNSSILSGFNLMYSAPSAEVKAALKANPKLYSQFKSWYANTYPGSFLNKASTDLDKIIAEFLETNPIAKKSSNISELKKDKNGRPGSGVHVSHIQGTGGLSYQQAGRITNTPNGYKFNNVVQGRLMDTKLAVISGFTASVMGTGVTKSSNYMNNVSGRTMRQFTMPFKVNKAVMHRDGQVVLNVDPVTVGNWEFGKGGRDEGSKRFNAQNTQFARIQDRNSTSDPASLMNLLSVVNPK